MDFLDPQKQKRHTIRLAIGYTLTAIVLGLATLILLYQAYGWGIDRRGNVIQKGLVFVSSRPAGADIAVRGSSKEFRDSTNARMTIPAGQYAMEVTKPGYRTWKRALTVEGGRVERFDYPLLLPGQLATTATKRYTTTMGLFTQSTDRRWLLTAPPDQNTFDLFDLNASRPAAQSLSVPTELLAAGSITKGWQPVEWAKDNRHVILQRLYEQAGRAGSEYILLDRQDPAASQNLTVLFGFTPSRIELRDRAHDRYYLLDQNSGELFTASLEQPTPQPYISGTVAFASEKDIVVYATAQGAPSGKMLVRVRQAEGPAYTIRQVPLSPLYLLDTALYEDRLYIAAGAQIEDRVYVYKDPLALLKAAPKEALAPIEILKVTSPNYLAFSAAKRFVVAESGDRFGVYDAESNRSYAYQAKLPPDAGVGHAVWADEFRLSYVSGGKQTVFDYDGTNSQQLSEAAPLLPLALDRKYRFAYTISPQNVLTATALLTPEDL